MSHPLLQKLSRKQIINMINNVKVCTACGLSKGHLRPVHRNHVVPRTIAVHSLILVDFSAHITPRSREGHEHVMYIMDDASSELHAVTCQKRSDAPAALKKALKPIIDMCKRHGHSVRVQATKSDFAKEFMSEAFKEVAAELGTARATATAPHHKNSLARLDNAMRSVQSMASSMLHHGQAPPNEWGRAMKCSCCLHRRLPNSGLGGLTPVEKTRGSFHRPDMSKFRVFHSPVFIVKTSREKHRSAKFGPTHRRPWEGATSFLGCFLGCRKTKLARWSACPITRILCFVMMSTLLKTSRAVHIYFLSTLFMLHKPQKLRLRPRRDISHPFFHNHHRCCNFLHLSLGVRNLACLRISWIKSIHVMILGVII